MYVTFIKKPYMHTIIVSSGRDYFNYLQIYGSNAGLFEEYLFWVDQYEPPPLLKLHVGKTKPKLT